MRKRIELSEEEAEEMSEGGMGICLACHHEQSGVEPDGRKYTCEKCGQPKVYGVEELALMGLIHFTEEAEE